MTAVYCWTCRRDHEQPRCEVCGRNLDNLHALVRLDDRCKALLRLTRVDPPASALGYPKPPVAGSSAHGVPSALSGVPVADQVMTMDVHSHYVYCLAAVDGTVLYVGKSGRVWARIAEHLRDHDKRAAVALIQTFKCMDANDATRIERSLITELRPSWNVQHARS